MTTKENKNCDFDHFPFSRKWGEKFKSKWRKMSDQEKLDFMNKRIEGSEDDHMSFFIEKMDEKCEKWLQKSIEEKQTFLKEKKRFFKKRMSFINPDFFNAMNC